MKFCESRLEPRQEIISDFYGKYKLSLNLASAGLQSSFYYFLPERYEFETQRYIVEFVKPGMTTIDVGAHLGLFTVLMADRTGPQGKVYSFEPEAKNFLTLKENVELNHLDWVRLFQMAVSNKTGEDILMINSGDSFHALGVAIGDHPHASFVSRQTIQTITLDDLIEREKINKIDLIKIDAELSELLVFEGAKRSFKNEIISQIICEIHSSHKQHDSGRDSVRKVLYSYGYKSFVLNPTLSKKNFLAELLPNEPVHGLQNLLFKR